MSQQGNDIKQYSAADFERYHSGKMTASEMHALEKAALDDPFLSDALDGYMHTKTAVTDINELKNKLLKKERDEKVIWFRHPLLKIAAVLILFAGFGWLFYKNNNPKQYEIAAIKDNSIKSEIDIDKMTDTVISKEAEGIIAIVPEDAIKQQQNIYPQKNIGGNLERKKEIVTVPDATVSASDATNFTLTRGSVAATSDSVSNTNTYYTNIQPESANNNNINNALAGKVAGAQVTTLKKIRGRITDSKGNPVSFANVIDKKNNIGVQSDKAGSFAFITPDSAPKVDVNAIGYKAVTKSLSNDSMANNLVLLEQDNVLKEVILNSAFQTKRAKRSQAASIVYKSNEKQDQRITVTNAIPVNGWQGFNKYVSDSLKTIEQLGPTSVSAEVLVSFNVNDNGEPVDINVKRSLCSACDAEAVRIIKNSTAWKLNKKRKKANAVVRF